MIPIHLCGIQGFKGRAQSLGIMCMSSFYGEFTSREARKRVLERSLKFDEMMLDGHFLTRTVPARTKNRSVGIPHLSSRPSRSSRRCNQWLEGAYQDCDQIRTIIELQGCPYDCSPGYVKKSCRSESSPRTSKIQKGGLRRALSSCCHILRALTSSRNTAQQTNEPKRYLDSAAQCTLRTFSDRRLAETSMLNR